MISRHVLIDPTAWQILAREARRRRTTLMNLAGKVLITEAAALERGGVTGLPSTRRRRSPGEGRPQPTDRVVRLLGPPEVFDALADAAATTETSTARYMGAVLEAAAHTLGWRCG